MRKFGYVLLILLAIACGGGDQEFIDNVVDTEGPNTPGSEDPDGSDSDSDTPGHNDNGDSSDDTDSDTGDGTDEDSDGETNNDNTPPEGASLVFPLNETECSNSDLTFEWNASIDVDDDVITYTLVVDSSPSFDEDPKTYETNSETNLTLDLPLAAALYWKVISSDSNDTIESETWSLYTQGEGVSNSVPQLEYISPNDNKVFTTLPILFEWLGTDNETTNDDLIYKLYISEVGQALVLQYEGNQTVFSFGSVFQNRTYQWAIYVTDSDGATNVGEVYTFKVE